MIECIDHFVLTVKSLEKTCEFYEKVLLLKKVVNPGKPTALSFGNQKINVHEIGHEFTPAAKHPTSGAGDFCMITTRDLVEVKQHIENQGVTIELGPVSRTGARGPMTSLYFRDPDLNLVEVSRYD
jgi:catechol 2,3-dioxygenase-like lactoylglutathione lyase family enzyme